MMKVIKEKDATSKGFTHLGKIYGFYCFLRYESDGGVEVKGIDWFRERMIILFSWIEVNLYSPNDSFVVEEIRELRY